MSENDGILNKLLQIQQKLKVEKGIHNDFGNFDYRSREDILEAVKPYCGEMDLVLLCEDSVICLDNGWVYVISTAELIDVNTGESIKRQGLARESETKPKMDSSQCTGTASSYAGKRALGNLFALDDSTDVDALDNSQASLIAPTAQSLIGKCPNCGTCYEFQSYDQMRDAMCRCGAVGFDPC